MGWTGISEYETITKNGKIDRKATLDFIFNCDGYTVIRSCLKSTTYYAAIKHPKNYIFGLVVLTSIVNDGKFKEFMYKDMDESMEPYYYDCPISILKLLSNTDNENSLNWRNKCKRKNSFNNQLKKHGPIEYTCPYDMGCYKKGSKVNLIWKEKTPFNAGYYTDGFYRFPHRLLSINCCKFI